MNGPLAPFRQLVLKVHSRCDLACDHCYMYEHQDQALLAGPDRLRQMARTQHDALSGVCDLDLRIHTNRVLLDEAYHRMFADEGVLVGYPWLWRMPARSVTAATGRSRPGSARRRSPLGKASSRWTGLELVMDVTRRRAAWSAAWGVVAVVLGGGAIASWTAAAAPGSKFPVWPVFTLTALTAIALYVSFAYLAGRWPTNRGSMNGDPANVQLVPEQVGNQLRLMLVNNGRIAEFSAQVIEVLDPLRQKRTPQHWTIPWLEDNSVEPKRILAGGRRVLDFASYDDAAVNAEFNTGHDGADHWRFAAVPTPLGIKYYNLRSRSDLELQRFILTVRIMNARSGRYLDHQLTVGIDGSNLICGIVPVKDS
jgi:hypothetical protein